MVLLLDHLVLVGCNTLPSKSMMRPSWRRRLDRQQEMQLQRLVERRVRLQQRLR